MNPVSDFDILTLNDRLHLCVHFGFRESDQLPGSGFDGIQDAAAVLQPALDMTFPNRFDFSRRAGENDDVDASDLQAESVGGALIVRKNL